MCSGRARDRACASSIGLCGMVLRGQGYRCKTLSGKIDAIQQFYHRLDSEVELRTDTPFLKRGLLGVGRAHVQAGAGGWIRVPVSRALLLGEQMLVPSWGPGGRVLWLYVWR